MGLLYVDVTRVGPGMMLRVHCLGFSRDLLNRVSFNIEKMYENFDFLYENTENQSLLGVYSGCALAIESSRNLLKTEFRKAEYTDIYDEEKKIINQDIVKDERTGLLL